MEIYTIARPSVSPAAVCALLPAAWRPSHDSVVTTVAQPIELPRVHQVRVAAVLALTPATAGSDYGTNGFRGTKGTDAAKQMAAAASGVPPRGRPV